MSEQKPFTAYELPTKVVYTVLVKPRTTELCLCATPDCENDADQYGDTQFDEVYECQICGQWFCIDHIGDEDMCKNCEKLPTHVQDEVREFRERLNH